MNKSKQDSIYFFWSASIVLCMLLALFALLFTSCAKPDGEPKEPANTDIITPAEQDEPTDTDAQSPEDTDSTPAPGIVETEPPAVATVLGETEDMGQEYIDKMVFLGDSTTNGLAHYDVVPQERVWTPKSGTLTLNRWSISTIVYEDGSEISITDAVAKKQPEYLCITLGVNGVSFMGEEDFKRDYTAMVEAIQAASPDTKIILNSIYPVCADYKFIKDISNEKIDAANTWIESIAEATGCRYLNSSSILKDETGAMHEGYDNNDGIHPNGDTYKKIVSYIRTHGYV